MNAPLSHLLDVLESFINMRLVCANPHTVGMCSFVGVADRLRQFMREKATTKKQYKFIKRKKEMERKLKQSHDLGGPHE